MAKARKTIGDFPYIGGPAANALEAEGITTMKQLAAFSEAELLQIHGVGAKAIHILREAMAERGMTFNNFPMVAAPAQRALASAGYTSLTQLTQVREADLLALHGMGKKALDQLREALAAKGLSFQA